MSELPSSVDVESQVTGRVRGFTALLKDGCGEFFWSSVSRLRGLFLHSDDGVDRVTSDLGTDAGNVHWLKIMAGLSMTAVMEVSIGYLQVRTELPTEFILFCLAVLLAFDCFFVASCIYRTSGNTARVLETLGVCLMFTGVFTIVAVPFPHFFKIITWAVYVISVAAILAIRYFNPQ